MVYYGSAEIVLGDPGPAAYDHNRERGRNIVKTEESSVS